ncbi:sugar ABC transporter ATP-binding protein [Hespellia stercorisuis]|uniref:Erythritol transport system ATP-binding protein n=1 Tax=Hespellia stercorisuis DSM 15480 TaxID=1121950 RepID=A0A1M6MHB7_9FIRM|nr:sugar ABC transporter ATP-binding protein [Hespellia stercorisuis]SHJ82720.1 erythritol transport system ATP-binding protein [Hespellia stercorisuis DSM 15480]
MDSNVVLHAEGMNKIYPGTKALDNVSYDVMKGKVNVLIGENGAGKSTLMKLIAGIEQPSSGKMYMADEEVSFKDTTEARDRGIGIIHQELSLFPNLNVYQNVFMGREQMQGIKLDNKKHISETERVLEKLEHVMDPNTLVGDLRVGQQQMIEIARNFLQDDLKILIMDEPTSSLSEQEVEVLFKLMREFTDAGIAIVYISHRLEEIMQIGDNVTILRDGKYVARAEVKDINVPWIVEKMVGQDKNYPKKDRQLDWEKQEKVLEVKNLTLPKKGGGYLLDNVSFDLKKGEILGIYGLMGAGRTEIFECIMGLRPEHTGEISKNGKLMNVKNINEQIKNGFALVPEDRQGEGLVQTMSIKKNISLSSLENYTKGGVLQGKLEDENVDKQIKDIMIKVADKDLPILSLSGGNQQKVVIGKGILTNPEILLLDEPSRGIDIGAKTEVFDIINQYAERGLSIMVVSSELKEIVAIADRVIVLSNGIKTGEFRHEEITEDGLVLASYKGHSTHKEVKED